MGVNKKTARIAGLLYLTIIVAGIFAEFFVRSNLIVPGDAGATAANILAAPDLLRTGIAADLVMIVADIAIAATFFVLLRPVGAGLSLLAAFFRLTQAAILGVNLLNMVFALQLLSGASYLSVFSADQLYAQALFFLGTHGIGYAIALIFFAFSCMVLGYLVYRSGYFPKILGVLLMIAGAGYLVDSSFLILSPNYEAYETVLMLVAILPAFIGEVAMCGWLLVKGVSEPAQEQDVALAAPRAEGAAA